MGLIYYIIQTGNLQKTSKTFVRTPQLGLTNRAMHFQIILINKVGLTRHKQGRS